MLKGNRRRKIMKLRRKKMGKSLTNEKNELKDGAVEEEEEG